MAFGELILIVNSSFHNSFSSTLNRQLRHPKIQGASILRVFTDLVDLRSSLWSFKICEARQLRSNWNHHQWGESVLPFWFVAPYPRRILANVLKSVKREFAVLSMFINLWIIPYQAWWSESLKTFLCTPKLFLEKVQSHCVRYAAFAQTCTFYCGVARMAIH